MKKFKDILHKVGSNITTSASNPNLSGNYTKSENLASDKFF